MNISTVIVAWALLPVPSIADAAAMLDTANERMTTVCVEPNPLTGHVRKAHCAGWASRSGRRVWYSYNGLGLRDKDYPARPAPGVLRILAADGSILAGSGLKEKDSPARALERALKGRGLRVEVINAAGSGYAVWQNAVWLKRYLKAYSPRVVLFYLPSHFIFTERSYWRRLRRDNGNVVGIEPWLLRLRFLVFLYIEQWDRIHASWKLRSIRDPAARLENLLAPVLSELRQMRDACRASGARFFVVYADEEVNADYYVLPERPPVAVRFEQWFFIRQFRFDGAVVEKRLRDAGLEILSIAGDEPGLRSRSNRLPGDYHWNESGANLFGEAAAREFVKAWKSRY
ncbi:MAG: hypothetical protein HY077_07845 [Elusimicrobia bacterium]|nr:hypothetical protein [Elusimicrobiota bacterium]